MFIKKPLKAQIKLKVLETMCLMQSIPVFHGIQNLFIFSEKMLMPAENPSGVSSDLYIFLDLL